VPVVEENGKQAPRDGLGRFFFAVHVLVVLYTLCGWIWRPGLGVYLVFLPAMVLHWPLNGRSCILNNAETLLRSGRWRDPANREEGAWLHCLIVDVTGLGLSRQAVEGLTYGLLVLLWGLGWWHWAGWPLP